MASSENPSSNTTTQSLVADTWDDVASDASTLVEDDRIVEHSRRSSFRPNLPIEAHWVYTNSQTRGADDLANSRANVVPRSSRSSVSVNEILYGDSIQVMRPLVYRLDRNQRILPAPVVRMPPTPPVFRMPPIPPVVCLPPTPRGGPARAIPVVAEQDSACRSFGLQPGQRLSAHLRRPAWDARSRQMMSDVQTRERAHRGEYDTSMIPPTRRRDETMAQFCGRVQMHMEYIRNFRGDVELDENEVVGGNAEAVVHV